MGRRHQQVVLGQPGLLVDQLPGGVEDLARDAHVVADGERQPGLPVVEDQAAGVQLVVDVGGRGRCPTADDRLAERGRDVARRRTGPEHAILLGVRLGLPIGLGMKGGAADQEQEAE